jgi:hypothetical protein
MKICYSSRWFIAVVIALVLFKFWLVSAQTIVAVGSACFDDALFVKLAKSLLGGHWLGTYNEYTLAKGPMYSLFIAFVFLLGVPLFAAQQIFYAAACGLLVRALRPLVPHRGMRLGLFAVLLFNPVTYDGGTHARVLRQDILYSLVLVILAGLIALYARCADPKRRLLPWALLTGTALPMFWLTREEGVWFLPCVGLLWLAAIVAVWRDRAADRRARLILLTLPGLMWAASIVIVAGINLYYYGIFTTCEFRQADFKAAFGSILRVEPVQQLPYVRVTREVRQRLYGVSPSFAELRSYFEGPAGEAWAGVGGFVTHLPPEAREIPVGWFMWGLRAAVVAEGHGHNGAEAMAYYAKIAREINNACDSGKIKSGPRRTGFMPPLQREMLGPFFASAQQTMRFFTSYQDITLKEDPSSGSPAELAMFADLTRGRLSPVYEGPPIPKRQLWLDSIRLGLLGKILCAYQVLGPWLDGAASLAFLATTVIAIIQKRLPYFLIVSAGMLASNFALIIIVALINITSFPAINTGYFSGGYGLWLFFIFTSCLALADVLRPKLGTPVTQTGSP